MATVAPGIGMRPDVDVYSLSDIPVNDTLEWQSQMRGQDVQTMTPAEPVSTFRWATANESGMSDGTSAEGVQRPRGPRSAWLTDALRALSEMDDEIAENGLPEVSATAKKEAERIIVAYLKFLMRVSWSLYKMLQVLQLNLFERRPLLDLLTTPSPPGPDPPDPQLSLTWA